MRERETNKAGYTAIQIACACGFAKAIMQTDQHTHTRTQTLNTPTHMHTHTRAGSEMRVSTSFDTCISLPLHACRTEGRTERPLETATKKQARPGYNAFGRGWHLGLETWIWSYRVSQVSCNIKKRHISTSKSSNQFLKKDL